MLFFVAGSVKDRYHTLEIKRLGGMLKQMPKLGWIMGFCAMASLGLPGLAGFWGEFPAIVSAYNPFGGNSTLPGVGHETFRVFMIIAAVGTVLAAGYLLWLFQRVAFGEPKEEFAGADAHDVHGGHGAVSTVGAAANADAGLHADGHSDIHDVKITEWLAWSPFLIGIVVFGIYPNLLFKVIDPASQVVLKAFGKG
ncbi:MAG: nuoM, partial [Ilumatobacteraceae bacterium]|nr:nuoM [Ilumatobacteraceae bacterium]